jgi:hypothetical protein
MNIRFAVAAPKQFAAQVKKAQPSRKARKALNVRLFKLFAAAEVPAKSESRTWRAAKATLLNKGVKAVQRQLARA